MIVFLTVVGYYYYWAGQAAELSKTHAEAKEEEARILERSVEELESTVYALESQVGGARNGNFDSHRYRSFLFFHFSPTIVLYTKFWCSSNFQLSIVKRESERQRGAREVLEKDLEALKRQIGLMQMTIDSQETQTVRDFQDVENSKTELDRYLPDSMCPGLNFSFSSLHRSFSCWLLWMQYTWDGVLWNRQA